MEGEGGPKAPLLLFKKKECIMADGIFTRSTLVFLLLATAHLCQAEESGSSPVSVETRSQVEEKETFESYFDDIMVNLPSEVKAQIDTAKGSGEQSTQEIATGKIEKTPESIGANYSSQLDELPLHLRKQVEKTIQDLDAKTKQRELEFRQLKERRQSGISE